MPSVPAGVVRRRGKQAVGAACTPVGLALQPGAMTRRTMDRVDAFALNASQQQLCVSVPKAMGLSGGTLTSWRHARRHGAIQNTRERTQQLQFRRGGFLIVPDADGTSFQQA